jgi:hypothetical protein
MAGRQRMAGARYPSGDRHRTERTNKEYSPSAIKRITSAAVAGMHDPEWGTVIGRLYLEGKLTSLEYATGKRWAVTWAEYCAATGIPSPNPRSVVIGAPARSEPPDPDSERGQAMTRLAKRAMKRFDTAHAVLLKCGMQAEAATRKLCEGLGETPLGHEQFLHAKRGLVALAKFWS